MWKRLKELMLQTDTSTRSRPAIHTTLERPNNSLASFKKWKDNTSYYSTMDWILSNYQSYLAGGKVDRSIAFLNTPSKKGFVLYLADNNIETQHPEHLMDYLKERIINLGYNLYTSDLKSYSAQDGIETQQRHYLKPPLEFVPNKKLSQLFGNISIDLILKNDNPYLFKFSATTYQDHMFADAKKFDQLMKTICVI